MILAGCLFTETSRRQNLTTRELLDLGSGSELHEERFSLTTRSQDEEDDADVEEISREKTLHMSLVEDSIVLANGEAGMKCETLRNSGDTVALKLRLRADRQMSWCTERYLFHVPQCSQPLS